MVQALESQILPLPLALKNRIMIKFSKYEQKLYRLKKQYSLYNEFYKIEKLSSEEKHKLLAEMRMILKRINEIQSMTVLEYLKSSEEVTISVKSHYKTS